MKSLKVLALAGLGTVLCLTLSAQANAPVLSDALKAEFFKAQSQFMQAEMALERTPQWKDAQDKEQALNVTVGKLRAACGTDELAMDKSGDPVCTPKPAPIPRPEKH